MNTQWRPMMAITYMAINICDFILFPVLWVIAQLNVTDMVEQWDPMTLRGGGFIHIAFMAILGISAWTRGQEKIEALKQGKTNAQPDAT